MLKLFNSKIQSQIIGISCYSVYIMFGCKWFKQAFKKSLPNIFIEKIWNNLDVDLNEVK